jgi:hypothetical protein
VALDEGLVCVCEYCNEPSGHINVEDSFINYEVIIQAKWKGAINKG